MWSLAWPWMLAVLPLPLLARKLIEPLSGSADAGLKVPDLQGFAALAECAEAAQVWNWRLWVMIVGWMLLVLASARPAYIGDELDVPVTGRNLMLAVDLSGSMDAKDFQLGNRSVDRLTATKAVASDFISRREGDRIGLILFGENAYLQVPLTLDRDTVNVFLMESFIGLAGEKTAIGDAITLAVKRIYDQGSDAGEQVLILLTDGANTAGAVQPIRAAELAAQIGLRIHTIGIGADSMLVASIFGGTRRANPSADLDEETLKKIAELTGGRYFRARDTAALQEIYRILDRMEPVAEPESGFRPVKALYYWPLAGALLLAFLLTLTNLLTGLRIAREARVKLNA